MALGRILVPVPPKDFGAPYRESLRGNRPIPGFKNLKITDYETGRSLSDLGLLLSLEEAAELRDYLSRLIEEPVVSHAYLTELGVNGVEKEIAISIDRPADIGRAAVRLPLPRSRPLALVN